MPAEAGVGGAAAGNPRYFLGSSGCEMPDGGESPTCLGSPEQVRESNILSWGVIRISDQKLGSAPGYGILHWSSAFR
jgi:hypothetical protein